MKLVSQTIARLTTPYSPGDFVDPLLRPLVSPFTHRANRPRENDTQQAIDSAPLSGNAPPDTPPDAPVSGDAAPHVPHENPVVLFEPFGIAATCSTNTTILELAQDNAVNLAYGCEKGNCRQCVSTLVAGTTRDSRDGTIHSDGDAIQICMNHALTNITIESRLARERNRSKEASHVKRA